MTPYNTKLWGLPPREMSADWVRAFVPTVSTRDIFRSFFGKNNTSLGYNSYFVYPDEGGVQSLVDGLAAARTLPQPSDEELIRSLPYR